ncbi:MAG TPA: hypothetical protein VL157_02990 [Gemmatimonadaceae bacterium]|nr:hypothetical protein [Gemmatimonadaceae bacterium]
MRLTCSMCAAMLIAAAGCSSGLTAPPKGLPVDLTFVSTQGVQVPSITSGDDSVTAVVMESGAAGCHGGPLTPAAGVRGEELVVTLTQPVRTGPCPPVTALTAVVPLPLKVVVHHVPSGTSSAKVVLRLVSGDHATYTVLASGAISVQ